MKENTSFLANVHKSVENLRAAFNEAQMKTFPFRHYPCRVDPYLVISLSS